MNRTTTALLTAALAVACGSDKAKPAIQAFTAAPDSVEVGTSTQLVFSATNASTLSIDNGVGDVTGKSSIAVTPAATTTYTLTATGDSGAVTATATITVTAARAS